MGFHAFYVMLGAWTMLLCPTEVESVACATGVVVSSVASSVDAQNFADALSCTGGGVFEVTWTGSVAITEPFKVSGGSAVNITGASGFAPAFVLSDGSSGATAAAIVRGQGGDGIFIVSDASTLTLNNLVLQEGNSSADGGAIYVPEASVISVTDCGFLNNSATGYGGAIFAESSEVTIDGSTQFIGNSARYRGGALYGNNSEVAIRDTVAFTTNTAHGDGGAIYADRSNIAVQHAVVFEDNRAEDRAGAIRASFSKVTVKDTVRFTRNTAVNNGGAVNAWFADFTFQDSTIFDGNAAAGDGGALSAYETNLTILDTSAFVNNSAGGYGGAFDASVCNLIIAGDVPFANNSAQNGGAVFLYEGVAHVSGGSFTGNVAVESGGAMSISRPTDVQVHGVSFVSNNAAIGGGVALTSSGDNPTKFRDCTFESNTAVDGGALYVSTTDLTEVVYNCSFNGNHADISGAAIFHSGYLGLFFTVFAGNTAGEDGTAVFSIGVVEQAANVTFDSNTLSCPQGDYGYDREAEAGSCRFEVACARCSAGCDDIPSGVTVTDKKVPTCVELMEGARASSRGTTIEILDLEEGYYRTSNKSQVVVECLLGEACVGGIDAENYCAAGYKGPYCSVCTDGYAPGAAYTCHDCSGTSMESAAGLAAAVLFVLLVVVGSVVSDLVCVVDGENSDQARTQRTPTGKLSRCRAFILKAFPLTKIKIIVVVWQIITQFGAIAGFVYPEEYQNFLSSLFAVNLDIGFILSYSCFLTTSFYDRLLISTIGPVVVLAALGLTFLVARKRNANSELAIRAIKRKHLSAVLFVMFFIYSSVSYTVFRTFVCDSLDDGVSYLRADYSVTCDTRTHSAFRAYAAVMVCVYPIGIPFTFAWLLRFYRRDLSKPEREEMPHLEPLSGLWGAYKPARYYYEVVECVRRIMLTGVAVFVVPGSAAQIAVVLLLAVVFLFVSESLSPFKSRVDMGLYRWGNGVVLASMYVALLLKVNVSEDGNSTVKASVVALIAANVFMVATVVIEAALLLTASVEESVEPISRSQSRGWLEDAEEDGEEVCTDGGWEGGCFRAILESNKGVAGSSEKPSAPSS